MMEEAKQGCEVAVRAQDGNKKEKKKRDANQGGGRGRLEKEVIVFGIDDGMNGGADN